MFPSYPKQKQWKHLKTPYAKVHHHSLPIMCL